MLYELIWRHRDRDGVQLGFSGVDELGRPVVWVKDSRREFYLPLRKDGSDLSEPADVVGRIRWLTDEEIYSLPVEHGELMFCLGIKLQPQQEDQ